MACPIPENPVPDVEQGHAPEKAVSISREQQTMIEKDHDSIHRIPSITRSRSQRDSIKPTGNKIVRILTTRSNASVLDPGPPPDGGVKAWTQALMGHLMIFNTWGLIATFGVFQSYYTTELGLEPSAVSWIGSIQMAGHFGLGMFSGRALDAGLYYWVLIPGVFISSLAMFMTSLCHEYYQLLLAQGIMLALGCGLQFTPTSALVYTYFVKNKALAIAIVASGSATGGLVYPTIARQLLPKIGFAWTTRVMGFMMLGVGAIYVPLLKPRLPPRKSGPLLELAAFREPPYTIYVIGIFLVSFGVFFVYYYINLFAAQVLGATYGTQVNILMVLNGVGLAGRLMPGVLADRYFGGLNTLIPSVFATSVTLYCMPLVKTIPGLYVWAVFYGFLSAAYQGTFPSVLSSMTKDLGKIGVRNGMGYGLVGTASCIGPPIAGALLQSNGGSYLTAQMWGASMIAAGGICLVLGRLSITGLELRVRV